MTIPELRKLCEEQEVVLLFLPPPNGQGYTRRLSGRRGPRGVIINGTERGQTVRFESAAVLRFLDREARRGED